MPMSKICIHWFREDLRIRDNPALSSVSKHHLPVVGLYIFENGDETVQKVWLDASLQALQSSLHDLKIPLLFSYDSPKEIWKHLLEHHSIEHVSWCKSYTPDGIKRDHQISKLLSEAQIPLTAVNGTLLLEPSAFTTGSGDFYKVFTPYWKQHQKVYEAPKIVSAVTRNSSTPSIRLESLNKLKHPLIHLGKEWEPGEIGAHKQLKQFIKTNLHHYEKGRDYPAEQAHSSLSPHLHFGEISPHTIVRSCDNQAFIRELVFRDFAAQLLFHIPHLDREPMKPQFSNWRWENDPTWFEAWKRGKTGFPIVDAGMRELLNTGFMHNRVRMIVASFLVKDLNIAWQKGAQWFLERLLDADLASNSFNWQWCAGTGPDAQPFFRIFNPLLQSKKFDGEGTYIRKWVPELNDLPAAMIHAPSNEVRQKCGYPLPLVNHGIVKKEALDRYRKRYRAA